ncbi:MAG: lytic transglycosylase domain-containing protein [Proteobacteria bacterium]|nr:lytic transglycosylase domain-containing protein [Pseudomonadota bacterium]
MGKIIAACLLLAAQTYSVPPAVLAGIYQVEGGQVGQEVGPNDNGSYDLGPMQINTIWLPELAGHWGVSETTARKWVRDDPCTNVGVAAWILKTHMDETNNLSQAIAHYHSKTPYYGSSYKKKVVASMNRHGLVRMADGR